MTNHIKDLHIAMFTVRTGCGKSQLVLDLIEKEHNKHYDNISITCQRQDGIRHILLKSGSDTMTKFSLQSLTTRYINEQRSCCQMNICVQESKHACLCIRNEHPVNFSTLKQIWTKHKRKLRKLQNILRDKNVGKKSQDIYIYYSIISFPLLSLWGALHLLRQLHPFLGWLYPFYGQLYRQIQ